MPAPKRPPVDPPPTQPPPAPVTTDEPEWSVSLRQLIADLPAKLTATITDQDRDGIAEHIVGLFESKGAFQRKDPDDPDDTKDGGEGEVKDDPPQQQDSLARRWFGPH
jgi:hypothetical protein